jgi:hypothetical protein
MSQLGFRIAVNLWVLLCVSRGCRGALGGVVTDCEAKKCVRSLSINSDAHASTSGYGLNGPGIEFRWEATFYAPFQAGPGPHPASCTVCTGSFLVVESGRGVTLTPHPFYCRGLKAEYNYTSTLPKGLRGLWKGWNLPTFRKPQIKWRLNVSTGQHNVSWRASVVENIVCCLNFTQNLL